MKKRVFKLMCSALGLSLMLTNAYTQTDFVYEWHSIFGVTGANEKTEDVIFDGQGNAYHTGLQNVTTGQVFLQKIDATGSSQWHHRFGGSSGSYNYGTAVTLDAADNVLITGSFQNSLIPTGGTALASNGADDIFVAKYSNAGSLLWSFAMGGPSLDQGLDIAVDFDDNVYVTGYFIGTMDFDPGPGVTSLTSVSSQDIFLAKYDASGNFLWAQSMGSTNGSNYGNGVITDSSGDVYVVGQFFGTVDFDPTAAVQNITSAGTADAFVAKYSSAGAYQWAFNIGSGSVDQAKEISIDANDDLYIAGNFRSTVDFDPGTGISNLSSSYTHSFLAKYTNNGGFVWARDLAGNSLASSYCYGMSHNTENEIGVTGYYLDSMVVDVSNQTSLISNGISDVYTVIYTPSGDYVKSLTLGGTGWDYGYGVDVSPTGKIAAGGAFSATVDFDPGSGTQTFNAMSGENGFLVQYGTPPCAQPDVPTISASASAVCQGETVTLSIASGSLNDAASWVWYEGACGGTMIGTGAAILVTPSATTTYFVRGEGNCSTVTTCASQSITIHPISYGTDVQTACDSFLWIDGNTYGASNTTATHTLTNAAGCDSIVTLNLTILSSSTGTDVQTACGSYTWIDGNTYASNNTTATHTLLNAVGCDSIVTLNLTILNASSGIDTQSACDSYTWIDGNTYNTSNNSATHTLTNAAGCDSIVTLNLTIQTNTINPAVTSTDGVNYAAVDNTPGNTYSWTSVSGGTEVSDSSSFSAPANGTYQLEITNGLCSAVSNPINVVSVSVNENTVELKVYPNPTTGTVFFSENVRSLVVFSLDGRIVKMVQSVNEIDLSTLPKGVYLLRINEEVNIKVNLQ